MTKNVKLYKELINWTYHNLFQFGFDKKHTKFWSVRIWTNDLKGNILYQILIVDENGYEHFIYVLSLNYDNIYQAYQYNVRG